MRRSSGGIDSTKIVEKPDTHTVLANYVFNFYPQASELMPFSIPLRRAFQNNK